MSTLSLSSFFPTVTVQSPIGKLTYQAAHNMFTTQAYTSTAGNTYFEGLRLSEEIVVRESVGIGHTCNFLNGIRIYKADGSGVLLAQKDFHCCYYSTERVRQEAEQLMYEVLQNAQILRGIRCNGLELENYAKALVQNTFTCNQAELVTGQSLKLLG